jgi:hypothetical protein
MYISGGIFFIWLTLAAVVIATATKKAHDVINAVGGSTLYGIT